MFYTASLSVVPLLVLLVPLALFTVLVQRRVRSWWLLLPLAFATWTLMHASEVHATVAGVLLGFAVPVLRSRKAGVPDAGPGLAEHFEHRFRPLSVGAAVPVFAFMSAGVAVGGLTGLGSALTDLVAIGIIVGLVVGKPIGSRPLPGWSPGSPGRRWMPASPGSTCSAWPVSVSPCRC